MPDRKLMFCSPFSSKNLLVCKCGSSKCRGFLGGPKPKEVKAAQPTTSGAKRKFKKIADESIQSTGVTKKRKVKSSSAITTTKKLTRTNGAVKRTQLKASSKITTMVNQKIRVAKHIRANVVSTFNTRKLKVSNKSFRSLKFEPTRRALRR